MNGYNFTGTIRKVLAMAREEAAQLHHEYVGTEHMLLALIAEGEGRDYRSGAERPRCYARYHTCGDRARPG